MELKIYKTIEDLPKDPNLECILDFSQVEAIVRGRYGELTGKEFPFHVRIHSKEKFERIPYVQSFIERAGSVPDGISLGFAKLIDLPYHNAPYCLYVIGHEIGHLEDADRTMLINRPFHDDAKATAFSEAFIVPVEQYYTGLGFGVRDLLDFNANRAYHYVRDRMRQGTNPMDLFKEIRDCMGTDCNHTPQGR